MFKKIKKKFFKLKKLICERKRLKTASIFLALFLIIFSLYFLFFNSTEVLAEWWNINWHYRKVVNITNSGSATTNQYVKITLDTAALITAGKMQSDCDDIRLTTLTGQELTYFIDGDTEYDCNDTDTSIYVLVDYIPTNGRNLHFYYGNPLAANAEAPLGTSRHPGLSCRNILEHRSDSHGDAPYYITPSGNLTDKIQVYCDMTTSGGGWVKVYEGLCTSATSVSRTLGNIVEISNNIPFNEMRTAAKNWSLSETRITTETARMQQTFSWYFEWVHDQPDTTPNPDVKFHDLDGNQDVQFTVLGQMLRGYGNSWRQIINGEYNTQDHNSYMYLGGVPGSIYVDDWGYGNYNAYMNNTSPREGGLGLTPWEFQEIYVWIRENNITLNIDQAGGSFGSEEKSPGPIAYWKFDEGYGTATSDRTTNNNDGTITNATWQTEDMCLSGKCLFFDGTGDLVSINYDYGAVIGTDDFSFSYWFKTTDSTEDRMTAIMFGREGYNGFRVNHNYPGSYEIHFEVEPNGGDGGSFNIEDNFLHDGGWHYLAGVRNSGTIYLYIDGLSVGTPNSATATLDGTYAVTEIGHQPGSGARYFNGFLDEVKIYSYARTPSQIKADYLARGGATSKGTSVSMGGRSTQGSFLSDGLVGYWRMDESSGTGVADSSGNGNSGTATGTTIASGKFNRARSFNGTSSDYVTGGSSNNLTGDNLQTITVSAWVKTSATASQYAASLKRASGGYSSLLSLTSNYTAVGDLGFLTRNYDDSTHTNLGYDADYNDGKWHHIVGVVNGLTRILYIDGVQRGTDNVGMQSVTGNTDPFHIGAFGTSNYFSGPIDEVRVYNRALSAEEVRRLYEWAPSPVLYLKMDDKTGDYAYDTSANSNKGQRGEGTAAKKPTWTQGKYGGGLSFDGNDDYLNVPIASSLQPRYQITMGAWVKPTDYSGDIIILGQSAYYTSIDSTGQLKTYWYGKSAAGYHGSGTSGDVPTGEWSYITAVWDDSYARLYVNGIEKNKVASTGTGSAAANQVWIGAESDGGTRQFNGLIDDVRIYDYARSTRQIIQDMNAGRPGQTGPVGYWKFDEGYGTTIKDVGGGGNNGTITGADWTNAGKFGKALSFNGSSDYVNIDAVAPEISGQGVGSISIWFKGDSSDSGGPLLWYSDGKYFPLGGWSSALPNASISYSSSCVQMAYQNGNGYYYDDTWHHAVMVMGSDYNELYVDGEKLSVDYNTGNANTGNCMWGTISQVRMAKRATDSWAYTGELDEVKIYNYPLTEDEVKTEYNRGQVGQMGTVRDSSSTWDDGGFGGEPPIAEWNFERQSSSRDGSSSSKAGTSCYDIRMNRLSAGDGVYWIDPDGSGGVSAFQTYCDMTTDGGGWTMIGSLQDVTDRSQQHAYDSTDQWGCRGRWTDQTTTGTLTNANTVDYKNPAYWLLDADNAMFYMGFNSSELTPEKWKNDSVHIAYTTNDFLDSTGGNFYNMFNSYYTFIHCGTKRSHGWCQPVTFSKGSSAIIKSYMGTNSNNEVASTSKWCFSPDSQSGDTSNAMGIPGVEVTGWNTEHYSFSSDSQHDCGEIHSWGDSGDSEWSTGAWSFDPPNQYIYTMFFNRENISSVYDSSGKGHTGTAYYGVSPAVGKVGSALEFDGSDDYVNIGTISPSPTTAVSMSAWIKPDTVSGTHEIIDSNGGWASMYQVGTGLLCQTGGTPTSSTKGSTITADTWHYVACTYDGSNIRNYIDGIEVGSTPATGSVSDNIWNISRTGNTFSGVIDQVRIYDYARSPAQVAWDYNQGKPMAHYKFDKCEGSIAYDSSGNGNNGTITPGSSGQTSVGFCRTSANTTWYNGRQGKQNSSLNFDGIDDYVSIGSVPGTLTEGTIAIWFNRDTSLSGYQMLFTDSGSQLEICYNTNTLQFYVNNVAVNTTNANNNDTWQHVVGVFSQAGNYQRMYLNGILVASGAYPGDATAAARYIGSRAGSYPFDGQIDDVRVYNYALDEDQIKTVYNFGAAQMGRTVEWGSSEKLAGKTCMAIKESVPSAEDGNYWIDPDGSGASQVYCDMTTAGGGWTLAMNLNTEDGNMHPSWNTGYREDSSYGSLANCLTADYKNQSVWNSMGVNKIMIVNHKNGTYKSYYAYEFTSSYKDKTMLWMFQNVERQQVTNDYYVSWGTSNLDLDRCAMTQYGAGYLLFNFTYSNNGMRIAPSNQVLSGVGVNDDKTRGLGSAFSMSPGDDIAGVDGGAWNAQAAGFSGVPNGGGAYRGVGIDGGSSACSTSDSTSGGVAGTKAYHYLIYIK